MLYSVISNSIRVKATLIAYLIGAFYSVPSHFECHSYFDVVFSTEQINIQFTNCTNYKSYFFFCGINTLRHLNLLFCCDVAIYILDQFFCNKCENTVYSGK